MIKTIKMHKPDQVQGQPDTADIHPDEVKNMTPYGWKVVEEKKPAKSKGKKG